MTTNNPDKNQVSSTMTNPYIYRTDYPYTYPDCTPSPISIPPTISITKTAWEINNDNTQEFIDQWNGLNWPYKAVHNKSRKRIEVYILNEETNELGKLIFKVYSIKSLNEIKMTDV